MKKTLDTLAVGATLLACAQGAQALDSLHGVEDAYMLGSGACRTDVWLESASRPLAHLGAACRTGPVELNAAVEHARQPDVTTDDDSWTGGNVGVTWTHAFDTEVSAGLAYSLRSGGHGLPDDGTSSRLVGLYSWAPLRSTYSVHINLGGDWSGDGYHSRWGVEGEWRPRGARGQWLLVGEAYREYGTDYLQAGTRFVRGRNRFIDVGLRLPMSSGGDSSLLFGFSFPG